MKFFVTSDIHSFLEPLKQALDEAGFDRNNPEHWLVCCGDVFDRGPDSDLLLQFLMSLERKILVKGNHDLLLEDCCKREFPYSHDFSNGTKKTIDDIGGAGEGYAFDMCCQRTWDKTAAYRASLVNYFETEHYVFCHAWPAVNVAYDESVVSKPWYRIGKTYYYKDDWRTATDFEWEEAMWCNPFEMTELGLNKTNKWLVVGHWHCSTGWAKKEGLSEFGEDAKWDIFKDDAQKVIFLDKCTAYTGQVNVLVLEDDFLTKETI